MGYFPIDNICSGFRAPTMTLETNFDKAYSENLNDSWYQGTCQSTEGGLQELDPEFCQKLMQAVLTGSYIDRLKRVRKIIVFESGFLWYG